jgi:hypothetical protein
MSTCNEKDRTGGAKSVTFKKSYTFLTVGRHASWEGQSNERL